MGKATAIYDLLHSDATIAGIVSTRIYPNVTPQDPTLPCIVFVIHDDDNQAMNSKDGASSFSDVETEFVSLANTSIDADTLSEAINTRLDGFYDTLDGYKIDPYERNRSNKDFDKDQRIYVTTTTYKMLMEKV